MSRGLSVAVRELAFLVPALVAPRRSRASTERRALRQLQEMHRYARGHVEHYRDDRYDVDLRSLSDLQRLPLLRKETLRELGPEPFWSDHAGWYQTDQTSGSTGRVIRVRHDAAAYGYHGATVLRRFLTSGYRPWWTIAQIKPFPRPHRWFQSLGLFRRTVVSSTLPEDEIARRVLDLRPQLLMGYPVMLRSVRRHLDDRDLEQLRSSLRLVFSDSELLPEASRQQLSSSYGVPVCDEYSAYEVLTVGAHCRFGSMHVDEDRIVLEIVDDEGRVLPEGEEGVVVVTHFRERAMPLLRYVLGDRAVVGPPGCRCGSRFRTMELTQGRTEDFVQVPGGRRIYIPTFVGIGITVSGFSEFMVRQDVTGKITIHVVHDPRSGLTFEETAQGLREALRDYAVPEHLLDVVPAERVELTSGGKARLIHSEYVEERVSDDA